MSNLTRVTEWTPFPQARQEEGKQGCSSPSGLFHSHVQRALLPAPQPPGGLGVSHQSPEGAKRQGRVRGTASHSFMQAEKYKPICADLKPTEGHLVGKRVRI